MDGQHKKKERNRERITRSHVSMRVLESFLCENLLCLPGIQVLGSKITSSFFSSYYSFLLNSFCHALAFILCFHHVLLVAPSIHH